MKAFWLLYYIREIIIHNGRVHEHASVCVWHLYESESNRKQKNNSRTMEPHIFWREKKQNQNTHTERKANGRTNRSVYSWWMVNKNIHICDIVHFIFYALYFMCYILFHCDKPFSFVTFRPVLPFSCAPSLTPIEIACARVYC